MRGMFVCLLACTTRLVEMISLNTVSDVVGFRYKYLNMQRSPSMLAETVIN